MGAITGTKALNTELVSKQLFIFTATVASASDTIDLSSYVSAIDGIVGCVITGGQDAAFTAVSASFSGTTVTVTSVEQDGTASTEWTGTTISLAIVGTPA